jgi:hypothetical protein
VQVGEKINLLYENAGGRKCDVQAINGPFVKCAQGERDRLWLNLTVTLGINRQR